MPLAVVRWSHSQFGKLAGVDLRELERRAAFPDAVQQVSRPAGKPGLQHRVQADDDPAGGLLRPHPPDELAELDHRARVEGAEQLLQLVHHDDQPVGPGGGEPAQLREELDQPVALAVERNLARLELVLEQPADLAGRQVVPAGVGLDRFVEAAVPHAAE